jgi:hypothetical protein
MTANFPSEDMAKNTVKIWSIMKSVEVAMMCVGNRHSVAAGTDVNSRPTRARVEEKADVIWFIVPRSIFSGWAEDKQTLLTFLGAAHGEPEAALMCFQPAKATIWADGSDIFQLRGQFPGSENDR